jgi:hypothetical protein
VTLAGREIDPAQGITADQRLTAQARWLQARGAEGTLQQLRQAVFTAVLNGRPVTSLIPGPDPGVDRDDDTAREASPAHSGPDGTGPETSRPAGGRPEGDGPEASEPRGSKATASGGVADRAGNEGAARRPGRSGGAVGAVGGDGPAPAATGPGVTGTVNLTMPLTAWLGLSDRPGEAAGYGVLDADACRDLAAELAAGPGARWCLTLTDSDGHAVAHACARRGPPTPGTRPPGGTRPSGATEPSGGTGPSGATEPSGGTGPSGLTGRPEAPADAGPGHTGPPGDTQPPPPGGQPRPAAPRSGPGQASADAATARWLGTLRPVRLEAGTCTHQREAPGYQPPRSLAHLVRVRQPTCSHSGCRRPARHCDLDHLTPYDQGGRTCECNLHPACRHHHQAKQCPGWTVTQPEPGTVTWTTPSGRTYTTRPQPYPS